MIFATGPGGEFGLNNGLPWNVPEDFKHFKKYTSGCTLVMSGSTFATLPSLLPGHPHAVIGRPGTVAKNGDRPSVLYKEGSCLRSLCEHIEGDVVVIGGRDFLMEAADFVDEASITLININIPEATHYIDYSSVMSKLADASLTLLEDTGAECSISLWSRNIEEY